MDKLISVIIPVYNVEKYLEECVDSVLAQTYKNLEIILVDDGATDNSGAMCDEYAKKDGRIQVVHQKNGGLSAARNTGFAHATGEYVYFLDSDDYILPETLELLIDKAESENSDVVFFDAVSFDDDTNRKCKNQSYIRENVYETTDGYDMLGRLLKNKDFHSVVYLFLIKRELIVKNKLSFINGIIYEDMVYTFQLFYYAGRVSQLQKPLYMRRYREGSIVKSKKTKRNFLSSLTVYNEILKFTDENNLRDATACEYIANRAFNAIDNYGALSSAEKNECRSDYKNLISSIKSNKAYGNKSLYARCYGVLPWATYKCFEKIRGK